MTRRSVYRVTILALPLLVAFVVSSGAATIGAGETAKILQEGNYLFMKANELSKEDPWQAKDLYQKAATLREPRIRGGHQKRQALLQYR
jgi:hypothetical protein